MNAQFLEKYALLAVRMGVNVEKGQTVIISSDVSNVDLVAKITDAAYNQGAREVLVDWSAEDVRLLTYLRADSATFDEVPDWIVAKYKHYDEAGACYIHVVSDNPDLLKDVDPDRIRRNGIASGKALVQHRKNTMEAKNRWTIMAVPSPAWAAKVFPGIPLDEAMDKLWKAIAEASRCLEDPIKAWEEHNKNFEKRVDILNSRRFKALRYQNSLGTDVTMDLPEGHIWMGGGEKSKDGVLFFPNIPTEEIFTMPHRKGVNGKIVASMPLSYRGSTIENFEFTFKDGRVVDYKAEKNQSTLETILETDEGANYLGELALVPHNSPISNMNILFYNTLFDENASCHFALGKAYATCLEGYDKLSDEQLVEAGVNDSLTHVDFMAGTADLSITGIGPDGSETPVFVDGNFAF